MRQLTVEEKTRLRKVRHEVENEKDEIVRRGREVFAAHEQELSETMVAMRRARESLGLTLQDVAERMGTDRANISRLESGPGNPTVATLARYAQALGRRLIISFEDHSA